MNIYDIANKSGVSIATISRVLNNSSKVSPKTREKVLSVINSEDYVPNAFARGLGLNSMSMIGVLCTDITDPFYANAVGNIEKFLKKQNKNIVLCCTGNQLSDKKKSIEYMIDRRVDAVILIGSAFKEENDNSHIQKAAKNIPVIIINGYINLNNVYCVLCDERGAMRNNVIFLSEKKCKNILYLYDVSTYSGNEKLTGFKEGMSHINSTNYEDLIIKVDHSVTAVQNKMEELLKQNIKIDAILASEDILAVTALNVLTKKGIKIPVIGFNNSIIAKCSNPSLTSVDNMLNTMCETAVRLLNDISEKKSVPNKTIISANLVERETFKKG